MHPQVRLRVQGSKPERTPALSFLPHTWGAERKGLAGKESTCPGHIWLAAIPQTRKQRPLLGAGPQPHEAHLSLDTFISDVVGAWTGLQV